ncbi:hypothetical protein NPIL_650011 [Nephila pilipes]|uniref:Uncharacterized protein n=1 Tax=Nephila pilipes TaxID=299642 RepID=A0A8X6P324_NEPPI|nr:hypothetical protein NPIL_650011 [Nephila pilipes]
MPSGRSVSYHTPGRPRILRTGKRSRPRKEYGQVSLITDCFETSPSIQVDPSGPNKTAWKNAKKEKHDALIKENAWTLVPRPKHKKIGQCSCRLDSFADEIARDQPKRALQAVPQFLLLVVPEHTSTLRRTMTSTVPGDGGW